MTGTEKAVPAATVSPIAVMSMTIARPVLTHKIAPFGTRRARMHVVFQMETVQLVPGVTESPIVG